MKEKNILKDILLKMYYDNSKTLNENNIILTLSEQQTSGGLTPEQKEQKAKQCGYSNWETYKNSNWKCITKPLTDRVAIQNFQDWYLTQKEKAKSNTQGLYTTKLCSKPCTKGQAVDGVFGENTKKLWNEYFFEYKGLSYIPLVNKNNTNLPIKLNWDQLVADEKKKELFSKMNP